MPDLARIISSGMSLLWKAFTASWFWWLRARIRLTPAKAGSESPRWNRDDSSAGSFLSGVNLPWFSYGNDFGGNQWKSRGGISSAPGREKMQNVFARLAAEGVGCIRWFLFADGRSGIRVHADGTPIGLDEHVFNDLDLAVETAEHFGLEIIFVLFDFHLCTEGRLRSGVQLGGRSQWILNRTQFHALIQSVLEPVLLRYGHHPRIRAWDIFNEPEWITLGLKARDWKTAIPPRRMRQFLSRIVELVHRCATQAATVGLVTPKALPLVRKIGLDLYQVHWYDRFDASSPLGRPLHMLKLDRPMLLGEFPTRGSALSQAEILNRARRSGYCGALAWSALAADRSSLGIPL